MPEVLERLRTALADRYRIERRLGEGRMATVYLAEDLKHKRKVALKVLRPELGAERFVQEIAIVYTCQLQPSARRSRWQATGSSSTEPAALRLRHRAPGRVTFGTLASARSP